MLDFDKCTEVDFDSCSLSGECVDDTLPTVYSSCMHCRSRTAPRTPRLLLVLIRTHHIAARLDANPILYGLIFRLSRDPSLTASKLAFHAASSICTSTFRWCLSVDVQKNRLWRSDTTRTVTDWDPEGQNTSKSQDTRISSRQIRRALNDSPSTFVVQVAALASTILQNVKVGRVDLLRTFGYGIATDKFSTEEEKKVLYNLTLTLYVHPFNLGVQPESTALVSIPEGVERCVTEARSARSAWEARNASGRFPRPLRTACLDNPRRSNADDFCTGCRWRPTTKSQVS